MLADDQPKEGFMKKKICELFAGVGGFRLGFDRLETGWETTWFSQWEPAISSRSVKNCLETEAKTRA